jgi:hypothetical protein
MLLWAWTGGGELVSRVGSAACLRQETDHVWVLASLLRLEQFLAIGKAVDGMEYPTNLNSCLLCLSALVDVFHLARGKDVVDTDLSGLETDVNVPILAPRRLFRKLHRVAGRISLQSQ